MQGGFRFLWCRTVGGCIATRYAAAGPSSPQDLRQDPAFSIDSEWWDRPAYESCSRRCSGLLGNNKYNYDMPVDAPQHMAWSPSPPREEEAKEAIPMEEYMPLGLSEEEAIRLAMEQSELLELGQWEGLGVQFYTSATDDLVVPPPPPHHYHTRTHASCWLGSHGMGVPAARSSGPAPCPWMGLRGATDVAACFGAASEDTHGALAVPLGPAATHRPHRGRRVGSHRQRTRP
jgi:hypothetical protein